MPLSGAVRRPLLGMGWALLRAARQLPLDSSLIIFILREPGGLCNFERRLAEPKRNDRREYCIDHSEHRTVGLIEAGNCWLELPIAKLDHFFPARKPLQNVSLYSEVIRLSLIMKRKKIVGFSKRASLLLQERLVGTLTRHLSFPVCARRHTFLPFSDDVLGSHFDVMPDTVKEAL